MSLERSAATTAVRVWDLPTRAFHWALAVCVVFSIVCAQIGGNAMAWHFRSGYAIFALLAFRLIWGFVGGRWSRFSSFVFAPATTLRYLRGGSRPEEFHDVGHSPLGSLSVLALLLVLALQVTSGLFADDEISNAGPLTPLVSSATSELATGYHKAVGQWVLIALVVLHVAAVIVYLRRGRNLVAAMIAGDKTLPADVPASRDTWPRRLLAVALLAGCALVVGWVVGLGGD